MLADSDSYIAVPVVFVMFGLPTLAWFASRYMKHRERMAMLERGLDPDRRRPWPERPAGGGVPPSQPSGGQQAYGAPPFGAASYGTQPPPYGGSPLFSGRQVSPEQLAEAEDQIRKGLRTTAIGLAVTFGLSFIGTGPWLIGGLVPLFIGLSMILNGFLSGGVNPFDIRFRTNRPWGGPPPPQPPPPTPPPGGGTYGQSSYDDARYTYRPGADPQIERDRPPERR